MNSKAMKPKDKRFLISLLVTISEQSKQQDFIAELDPFFICYSFFLNDTSKPQNSCAPKTPQFSTPQGNTDIGARYLAPMYGRLYHYAGNNPVRYIDPTGMMEEDLSPIDGFLTSSNAITGFFFALCEAACRGEKYAKAVMTEKFNELNLPEGIIVGFMQDKGDPFKCKMISDGAGKLSHLFLGATILINFIDVLLVYRNSGGDTDAATRRFVRNTITTAGTIVGGKIGAWVGSEVTSLFAPGAGSVVGGALGGISAGIYTNYLLNKKFDELGW